jgi:hypothetical protein
MRRLTNLALFALFATACKVVPASPDDDAVPASREAATATLGDTVRIGVGNQATFDGGRFVLTFDALVGDSRCPADAMCVWMGDAEARFRLVVDGRRAGAELHTAVEPRQVEYAGYLVRLVNVEPYPGTFDRSQPAPPAVAVVVVTRQ